MSLHQVLAIVVGLVLLPQASFAVSFNCKTNKRPAEQAICNTPELSTLDDELARLYFQIYNTTRFPEAAAMRNTQRQWLHERNACETNIDCIRSLYNTRIEQFRKVLG